MNPSTALAVTLVDELLRCGLRDVVVAPGSRSAPLAMEFHRRSAAGELRLHVRVDERSAAFLALGIAKVGLAPVAIVCTSGTAAAHFHAAVIEADESGVPLIVLTADRPPELRGTGANQTIDQLKLYGPAVRWFCELGVPEEVARPAYWRSAVARAWGLACGAAGGPPGPVHFNLALREPLVPDGDVATVGNSGRPAGVPWTRFSPVAEVGWTERGVIVCGDGDYDAGPLLELAERAHWPVLAEPSSNARTGDYALGAYQYLIGNPKFLAEHRPDVIISAGRPGLSRAQLALLRGSADRHVVLSDSARWSDPARSATDVAAGIRLVGSAASSGWFSSWRDADLAVRAAVDDVLDADSALSEPRLARDLAGGIPSGSLLWVASSQPVRDLDLHMRPRAGLRVVASRGASGIDGLISSAIGAALAHRRFGHSPAFALLGDLAVVHDAAGLMFGPEEPVPDLCLIVVNNDGGGIFSRLEQAAFPDSFERVFGTPHGTDLGRLAEAAGLRYARIKETADLAGLASSEGITLVELKTERPGQAALRAALAGTANSVL